MYNSCSSVVGCLPADLCFVFFQRRQEWLGLYVHHPDLFNKAMEFEKSDPDTKAGFTWIKGMSLQDILDKNEKFYPSLQFENHRKVTGRCMKKTD